MRDSGWNQVYMSVDSAVNTQNQLWFVTGYGGGSENWAAIGQFSSDGALRLTGTGDLNSPTMILTDTASVGIGSTSPASKLDVTGGAARIWTGAGNVNYATTAGSIYIEDRLEVDGDVYFGDMVTDNLQIIGNLNLSDLNSLSHIKLLFRAQGFTNKIL